MGDLTEKEKQILAYIKGYMKENDAIPSVAEIAGAAGISRKTAYAHMYHIEEKGYIVIRGLSSYAVPGMRFVEDQTTKSV